MKLTTLNDGGKSGDCWFAYKVPKLTRDASPGHSRAEAQKLIRGTHIIHNGNGH